MKIICDCGFEAFSGCIPKVGPIDPTGGEPIASHSAHPDYEVGSNAVVTRSVGIWITIPPATAPGTVFFRLGCAQCDRELLIVEKRA